MFASDTHGLLNPFVLWTLKIEFLREIQHIKPNTREVLHEKGDLLASFGDARKWGKKSKFTSGKTVIALENCC